MTTVYSQTLGTCWRECVRCVIEKGREYYDEDVAICELLGLSIEIAHPSSNDRFIENTGDQLVIKKMRKKFSKGVVMEDRPFTYGQLIYDMNGIDQFEWLLQRLRGKPETKSATISLLTPGTSALNLPCLTVLDAKIRHDRLHLQFFFRSQNIFGRQYANLLALADLHEKLAGRIKCQVGSMKGYVASAHIYDYDLPAARELVANSPDRVADQYYIKGPSSIRA